MTDLPPLQHGYLTLNMNISVGLQYSRDVNKAGSFKAKAKSLKAKAKAKARDQG